MEESKMVMEKARPHLESLSQLAPQLNKATDLYMDELKEIENELNKLNLARQLSYRSGSNGTATSLETGWPETGLSRRSNLPR